MYLTLKPHPCNKGKQTHDWIDAYNENDLSPYASFHVDLLWSKGGNDIYNSLYKEGKIIKVELRIKED